MCRPYDLGKATEFFLAFQKVFLYYQNLAALLISMMDIITFFGESAALMHILLVFQSVHQENG